MFCLTLQLLPAHRNSQRLPATIATATGATAAASATMATTTAAITTTSNLDPSTTL